MIVARSREELAEGLGNLRSLGRVALVPTMGFLHEGHLSLVDRARQEADVVAVSIFVNPLQFGPSEDLESYPRDESRDLALLEERGADLAFLPSLDVVYPDGEPLVTVDPGPMAEVLCGPHRPGHFRGVLTVVARLFGLFDPGVAVFGRKDYQQAVLIRRMVRDLEMGVRIVTAPIVREEDGLAMSSRNRYLDPEERAAAPTIHEALAHASRRVAEGVRAPSVLADEIRGRIEAHPLLRVQYADIVDPETLAPVERAEPGSVAAVAAFCGEARLIDNVVLGEA